jgi:heme-degrading monooxygenase HmoA
MVTLDIYPPSEQAQAAFAAIAGIRFTEGEVFGVDGPDGHLGPEAAGCLMVLHATMADVEGAERFWELFADVIAVASEAPGLIRFVGFDDGLSGYAIGWWRTEGAARAFAQGQAHRDAVKAHYRSPMLYSHYVGLFAPITAGHRHVFCEQCGGMTRLPTEVCSSCGNEVVDVFKMQPERTGAGAST